MKRSDNIEKLAEALAAAQGQITAASKDKENPHFRSKYADLASVWDACRAPLTSNGLSVVQTPGFGEGSLILETTLLHTSGQWISSELPIQVDTRNLQQIGSALTYARRYSLSAMVGVCPDDDDGEAAVQPQREQRNGHAQAHPASVRREPPREGPPRQDAAAKRENRESWSSFSTRISNERNREWQKAMMAFHLSPEERAKDENQLPNLYALTNHVVNRAIEKGAVKEEDVVDDAAKRDPSKARKAAESLWNRAPKKIAEHIKEYCDEKEQAMRVRLGMDDLPDLVGAGRNGVSDDDH